jgi:hypothetical protein
VYASAKPSFGVKGKKGLLEDSINFVKLGDKLSEAIITASELRTAVFKMFS